MSMRKQSPWAEAGTEPSVADPLSDPIAQALAASLLSAMVGLIVLRLTNRSFDGEPRSDNSPKD